MAFDPTKIGAQYKYVELTYSNISIAIATQVAPPNPYRVAIYFACNSGLFIIRPASAATTTIGFQVQNPNSNLHFGVQDSGPLCQQAWWGLPNNAANALYVLSVEWIPSSLG